MNPADRSAVTKKDPGNVVFMVDTAPQGVELLRVAGALSEHECWKIVFVFVGDYLGKEKQIGICRDRGYTVEEVCYA